MIEVRIGDDGGEGLDVDALAREALEQIAEEARAIRCPVHGTPPTIVMENGGLTMQTCCEALDDAIDQAFPEGEDESEDWTDDDWEEEEDPA